MFSIDDVARCAGISKRTVWRYLAAGLLQPEKKVDGKGRVTRVFTTRDVEKCVELFGLRWQNQHRGYLDYRAKQRAMRP